MLINIIFFVTITPITFVAMKWLVKEKIQAFEEFQD